MYGVVFDGLLHYEPVHYLWNSSNNTFNYFVYCSDYVMTMERNGKMKMIDGRPRVTEDYRYIYRVSD